MILNLNDYYSDLASIAKYDSIITYVDFIRGKWRMGQFLHMLPVDLIIGMTMHHGAVE